MMCIIAIISILIILLIIVSCRDNGMKNLPELDESCAQDISDIDLSNSIILIARVPSKEDYKIVNTDSWPFNRHTRYKNYHGSWSPGMYSRLHHWSPGFYTTSNWSYYVRPGYENTVWPENRWVRNRGSYYFINNRSDYNANVKNY